MGDYLIIIANISNYSSLNWNHILERNNGAFDMNYNSCNWESIHNHSNCKGLCSASLMTRELYKPVLENTDPMGSNRPEHRNNKYLDNSPLLFLLSLLLC